MRWTPGGTSDDIEDRRDEDDGGGGGGGFGFGGMHIGLGGVVVLFILSLVFKQNFFALLGGGTTAPVATTVHRPNPARDEAEKLGLGIVDWHKTLAPAGDTTCVFRDSAFADDVAKTNLAAILEQNGITHVRSL